MPGQVCRCRVESWEVVTTTVDSLLFHSGKFPFHPGEQSGEFTRHHFPPARPHKNRQTGEKEAHQHAWENTGKPRRQERNRKKTADQTAKNKTPRTSRNPPGLWLRNGIRLEQAQGGVHLERDRRQDGEPRGMFFLVFFFFVLFLALCGTRARRGPPFFPKIRSAGLVPDVFHAGYLVSDWILWGNHGQCLGPLQDGGRRKPVSLCNIIHRNIILP